MEVAVLCVCMCGEVRTCVCCVSTYVRPCVRLDSCRLLVVIRVRRQYSCAGEGSTFRTLRTFVQHSYQPCLVLFARLRYFKTTYITHVIDPASLYCSDIITSCDTHSRSSHSIYFYCSKNINF